jgi:hypothetical protein
LNLHQRFAAHSIQILFSFASWLAFQNLGVHDGFMVSQDVTVIVTIVIIFLHGCIDCGAFDVDSSKVFFGKLDVNIDRSELESCSELDKDSIAEVFV